MLRLTVLGLLVVNWLLFGGQYIFFNGGSFTESKNSFTVKIGVLGKLASPSSFDLVDDFAHYDFNHYMGFESGRKGNLLVNSVIGVVLALIWSTIVALFGMFFGTEGLLKLFVPLLVFLLVVNVILFSIEMFRLIKYYNVRHKKQIEPILDFLFPNGERLFDKVSFERQEKASMYRAYRLIQLNQDDFKIVYAELLKDGQLLDRLTVATNVLKREDASKLIATNKKLEKEVKSVYFALMGHLLDGLRKVDDLNRRQTVVKQQLDKLHTQTTSDNYVKQFEVVKELHKK